MAKRGRKAKNAKKDVENFEIDKEESLKVFTQERNLISEEVIKKFDIKPVGKAYQIQGGIKPFNGESYEESLLMAYAWRDAINQAGEQSVKLMNYFPQEFMGKSVLVGFKIDSQRGLRL